MQASNLIGDGLATGAAETTSRVVVTSIVALVLFVFNLLKTQKHRNLFALIVLVVYESCLKNV